jgi:isopenicillin N synthase-like dioxygenase
MGMINIDMQAGDAAVQFERSFKAIGFAVVTNHGIDQALIEQVYREWAEFFASERKLDYMYDNAKHEGYFPFKAETAKDHHIADIKEFYHYYDWGRYPQGLSDATQRLREALYQLASTLLRWLCQQMPKAVSDQLSMPLAQMIEGSYRHLLRVLHYPPFKGDEEPGAIRAAAHGDINLITILPSANEPGLQVKDKQGQWLDVPCEPGSIVINAGDMLQECSNGHYPSTIHRVINPTGKGSNVSRFSLPFFLHPADEVVLSKRYTAKSYFFERIEAIGLYEDES